MKKIVFVLPPLAGIIVVSAQFSGSLYELSAAVNLCLLGAYAVLALIALVSFLARGKATLSRMLVSYPLFVLPIFLAGHWVVAPSNVGIGSGGLPFFVYWLTKYPNFGPINIEVALGIVCMLVANFIPWVFLLVSSSPHVPARTLVFLLFVQLVFYLPVLVRLDINSIFCGLLYGAIAGPLLRLFAILSMAIILLARLKGKKA